MTNETLAQYANVSLYSAMAVFTIAMVCYALYLAGLVPARDRATAREEVLVTPGAAPAEATPGMPGMPPARHTDDVPLRARRAAGIAGTTTWLGGLLLVASVAMRGLAVHRWPLGNMFEFAVMGSMFTVMAFSIWSTRRDLRWLGLLMVNYTLDGQGLVKDVWILTPDEAAKKPWPATPLEAQSWSFDPVAQVWVKP